MLIADIWFLIYYNYNKSICLWKGEKMRYILRQKIFSFSDKFYIEDETGNSRYYVESKIFSFGDKLKLFDLEGTELTYIEQKMLTFLPEFNIYMKEKLVARVKKEFTFFKPKFNIESIYGNFIIQGEIFAHEFSIIKNGKPVAFVSKKWMSFSDTYYVDISDEEDHPFILSLAIVLDQILYDSSDK